SKLINNFSCHKKEVPDFIFPVNNSEAALMAIEALDGQLITNKLPFHPKIAHDSYVSDIENDLLKIVVINRYRAAPLSMGFVKNFGFKQGAIASSVAHDSHNIIVVGADDESLCRAV